jgi:hypothetical protein
VRISHLVVVIKIPTVDCLVVLSSSSRSRLSCRRHQDPDCLVTVCAQWVAHCASNRDAREKVSPSAPHPAVILILRGDSELGCFSWALLPLMCRVGDGREGTTPMDVDTLEGELSLPPSLGARQSDVK